jgi:hypothetical protein
MIVGAALIIGGIALVNSRYGTRPLFVRGGNAASSGSAASQRAG